MRSSFFFFFFESLSVQLCNILHHAGSLSYLLTLFSSRAWNVPLKLSLSLSHFHFSVSSPASVLRSDKEHSFETHVTFIPTLYALVHITLDTLTVPFEWRQIVNSRSSPTQYAPSCCWFVQSIGLERIYCEVETLEMCSVDSEFWKSIGTTR